LLRTAFVVVVVGWGGGEGKVEVGLVLALLGEKGGGVDGCVVDGGAVRRREWFVDALVLIEGWEEVRGGGPACEGGEVAAVREELEVGVGSG
jgi:hypothetical protein